MKGIVLAGGEGSRLYPVTWVLNKHLMPIFDKPMIYYPLSTLMLSGIRDFLLISGPDDLPLFQRLLGDGSRLGISIAYASQPRPEGIAEAFTIGREFLADESVTLILGDNIFYGRGLISQIIQAQRTLDGATIFGYQVDDPERYGVVEIDGDGTILSLQEKPRIPRSNYAVTGLYIYDGDVVEIAASINLSARGEREITDVNQIYLEQGRLRVDILGRGLAWMDAGTHASFLEASNYVATVEARQGLKIACLEEVAFRMGYIDEEQLLRLAEPLPKTGYGQYMLRLIAN